MTDLRPEELMNEETVEVVTPVVETVVENVVEKGGISLGKAVGIIGGAAAVAGVVYIGYKWYKNKKAKKNEETAEDGCVAESDFVETSEEVDEDSDK